MPLRNLVIIMLTALVSLACYSVAAKNRYASLFVEAIDVIEREALHEVPRRELFDAAMSGMMSNLDEHSMYISGELYRAFEEDMKQQFGGVGMYVDTDPTTGFLTVLAPIPGTPAFEAGILAGDCIDKIGDTDTKGLPRSDAVKLMRGIQGTSIDVAFHRGEETFSRTFVRAMIPVPSLHGDWRNGDGSWNYRLKSNSRIGYVRLLQFGNRSTQEFSDALDEIGPDVDALVFDLRNNSGGLLDAAIDISDMFLKKGLPVVRIRGRKGVLVEEHKTTTSPKFGTDKPVVVIVNRNSASASEIVAACLQDHGRAVVVGEQSWGKGTVQHMIPVERGKSKLKLTTSSYWRPSDKNIDRFNDESQESGVWGVQPTPGLEIEFTKEQIFEDARQRNRRDLRGLVRESDEPKSQDDTAEQTKPYVDRALQKAIQVIQDKLSNGVAA